MSKHIAHHRSHHYLQQRHSSLYNRALMELDGVLHATYGKGWEHIQVERLSSVILEMKQRVGHSRGEERTVRLLALLFLQAPRAARAQEAMDRHHHDFAHRSQRLYELIDFNDTFVDTVLALPVPYRQDFVVQSFNLMREVCRRSRTRMFSYDQFEAIVHGLSREVAVYLGAKREGYDAHMTSRVADGLGIDMQIADRKSGRTVNIDCKTPSAYHYRLQTLQREGRLSEQEVQKAMVEGYARSLNGYQGEKILVVLLCISPEVMGTIRLFEFESTTALGIKLRELLHRYGTTDDTSWLLETGSDEVDDTNRQDRNQ